MKRTQVKKKSTNGGKWLNPTQISSRKLPKIDKKMVKIDKNVPLRVYNVSEYTNTAAVTLLHHFTG